MRKLVVIPRLEHLKSKVENGGSLYTLGVIAGIAGTLYLAQAIHQVWSAVVGTALLVGLLWLGSDL